MRTRGSTRARNFDYLQCSLLGAGKLTCGAFDLAAIVQRGPIDRVVHTLCAALRDASPRHVASRAHHCAPLSARAEAAAATRATASLEPPRVALIYEYEALTFRAESESASASSAQGERVVIGGAFGSIRLDSNRNPGAAVAAARAAPLATRSSRSPVAAAAAAVPLISLELHDEQQQQCSFSRDENNSTKDNRRHHITSEQQNGTEQQ